MTPLVLLADSTPLFGAASITAALFDAAATRPRRAAYLGAANGDQPAYYELFQAAMERAGIVDTMHVRARATAAERSFLAAADLVLLAGGEAIEGMRAMSRTGVAELVSQRRRDGAWIIGVSAGAVQMGLGQLDERGHWVPMLAWLGHVVDAHDEANGWGRLRRALARCAAPGLGIVTGGAVIVGADGSLSAFARRSLELVPRGDRVIERRLPDPGCRP